MTRPSRGTRSARALSEVAEMWQARSMCRNIRTLYNFEPPATDDEVHASALQYVRKISGMQKPSAANREAIDHAVEEVAKITQELIDALVTTAPAKNREVEAAKARERSRQRFGQQAG